MAGNFTIEWHGDELEEAMLAEFRDRLDIAGEELRLELYTTISTPGPGQKRSKPGEPPHYDSENLRKNLFHQAEEDGDVQEVGTDVEYGLDLEYGNSHMQRRPWLAPTAAAFEPGAFREFMGKPWDGGAFKE